MENKETDEERIARLVEERVIDKIVEEKLWREMEVRGMLISETGRPEGAIRSFADIELAYTKGEISREAYKEAAKREGINL